MFCSCFLCVQTCQDLPKLKFWLKFPLMQIQKLRRSCDCSGRSMSFCKVHKLHKIYPVSNVTLRCRCQKLNNLPGTPVLALTCWAMHRIVIAELHSCILQTLTLPFTRCNVLIWDLPCVLICVVYGSINLACGIHSEDYCFLLSLLVKRSHFLQPRLVLAVKRCATTLLELHVPPLQHQTDSGWWGATCIWAISRDKTFL